MDSLKGRTVAVIGAGLLQVPVIEAAKRAGAFVVAVDMNPGAQGVAIADDFINSSTLDAENTSLLLERFHREKRPVNGVLTVGTDASYTVAVCAKKLGLPGIEPEAALNATDKSQMRRVLRKAKIPVPDFDVIDTYPKAIEVLERLGSDCVIKPAKNMGARGVRRVFNLEDLKEGFEQAMHNSPTGKVVLEQYIDAPELSIDALIYRDQIHITGVADRIIEYDPFFVETGHIMPSTLPEDLIHYAVDTFQKGIRALGITHGAAKGDIKVSSSGCYIGEIAARLSGGFMSSYTYPYSTGVDLMTNMVRVALGLEPTGLEPKLRFVSVERSVIAPPGIVQDVAGADAAAKIPGVKNVFLDAKPGQKIRSPQNNMDKSGHVIVAAPTLREALMSSHAAVRAIRIRTREDDDQIIPESVISERAKTRFNGKCFACPDCNGEKCRGMMPGVGGIATGDGFVNSVRRIRSFDIIPAYINATRNVDTTASFFGLPLEFPALPGPLTGSITNLGGAIGELDLARAVVKGANQAGTVGFVGDGATPTKFRIGIRVVMENFGLAVPVFKPRQDNKQIIERIRAAREVGAAAVGMDIDAASFLTMDMKGQNTCTKTREELQELVEAAEELPFILKGVLSPQDAVQAVQAGVRGLIVSNHGGRVSDALISPIDALPGIKKAVGSDALIILDGGVRSGADAVKALALGADLVMIGRPVMIAAVGGGIQGVRQYFQRIANEIRRSMVFIGADTLDDIRGKRETLNERRGY